ncbi:class I SAM-dependent methyltransferase [Streptomyces sp. NPDC052693]|uniref:class I SAM-dependent methyltransferase n=1 Tax=Streptomyces sp. NPDC052693 TaxID=3155814 RepID=UPI0034203959
MLCLASGGGQQGPVLAAAGARMTVLDNSPRQLEQDDTVAAREGLDLRTVLGDARDLSPFPDASFDLIVHPVSNLFIPEPARSEASATACWAPAERCTGFTEAPHHSEATAGWLPGYFATKAVKAGTAR